MKIAEMTLTELQDYALQLEQDVATRDASITQKDEELAELRNTNLLLQERNNKLFVQVEQGIKGQQDTEDDGDEVESCEEFAIKNLKGILK